MFPVFGEKKLWSFGWLLYFSLFLLIPYTACAENVLMVLSSDLKAFYEFYQGFREESKKIYPDRHLKVELLSEAPFLKAEMQKFKPQVVIGVGFAAVEALRPQISKEIFFPALILESPTECGIFLKPPLPEEAQQLIKGLRSIFPKGKIRFLIPCQDCNEAEDLKKFFPSDIVPVVYHIKDFPSDLLAIFEKPYKIIYLRPEPSLATSAIAIILVKQALYHKKILFGFSAYFCEIGAALCFEHDYKAAGQMAGRLDFRKLNDPTSCRLFVPFKPKINNKVLPKILRNDS